jgi:hypothetical protein
MMQQISAGMHQEKKKEVERLAKLELIQIEREFIIDELDD